MAKSEGRTTSYSRIGSKGDSDEELVHGGVSDVMLDAGDAANEAFDEKISSSRQYSGVSVDGARKAPESPATRSAAGESRAAEAPSGSSGASRRWIDPNLAAGAGGGLITTLLLHPLDLIKVRFQVQEGSRAAGQPAQGGVFYRSIADAVRSIARHEGARGFYRGVAPALWGSGLSWGLYFFFYESIKARVADWKRRAVLVGRAEQGGAASPPAPPSGLETMFAATAGGAATCFVTNPIWLVKLRMQLQRDAVAAAAAGGAVVAGGAGTGALSGAGVPAPPRPYSGMGDAFLTILREEGPRGLYRGLLPALLLTSHGAVQFAVYEELKRLAPPPADDAAAASGRHFVYGAGSKAAATLLTYPYQVVKARIQQRPPVPGQDKYAGLVDCVTRMWAGEGFRSFYRGFSANLLRVAPQSAITLTAYERIKTLLGD